MNERRRPESRVAGETGAAPRAARCTPSRRGPRHTIGSGKLQTDSQSGCRSIFGHAFGGCAARSLADGVRRTVAVGLAGRHRRRIRQGGWSDRLASDCARGTNCPWRAVSVSSEARQSRIELIFPGWPDDFTWRAARVLETGLPEDWQRNWLAGKHLSAPGRLASRFRAKVRRTRPGFVRILLKVATCW